MQRFSLIAILALVAVASAYSDKSLYIGHRERGDELIEQKEVNVGWLPFTIRKEEVTVAGDGNHIITSVEVIDLKKKDESAKPRITAGGPDQTYVNVAFESDRGHGIHYLVKVYGKRIAK